MDINVSLPDELLIFVKSNVETGCYTSSNEVVREALRLLERHDLDDAEKLRRLQHAWQEGKANDDFTPLDESAIKAAGRKPLGVKA